MLATTYAGDEVCNEIFKGDALWFVKNAVSNEP